MGLTAINNDEFRAMRRAIKAYLTKNYVDIGVSGCVMEQVIRE